MYRRVDEHMHGWVDGRSMADSVRRQHRNTQHPTNQVAPNESNERANQATTDQPTNAHRLHRCNTRQHAACCTQVCTNGRSEGRLARKRWSTGTCATDTPRLSFRVGSGKGCCGWASCTCDSLTLRAPPCAGGTRGGFLLLDLGSMGVHATQWWRSHRRYRGLWTARRKRERGR